MADITVVTMDSEYELSCTATKTLSGTSDTEVKSRLNKVIPRARSVYQLLPPRATQEPSHTYRPNIEDQRNDYYFPTAVAYDPAPPDLHIKGY
jgi:hypothetical protein